MSLPGTALAGSVTKAVSVCAFQVMFDFLSASEPSWPGAAPALRPTTPKRLGPTPGAALAVVPWQAAQIPNAAGGVAATAAGFGAAGAAAGAAGAAGLELVSAAGVVAQAAAARALIAASRIFGEGRKMLMFLGDSGGCFAELLA